METITLAVEPRQATGKGDAGRLRRTGQVPGVFYSTGKQATSLSINAREFHMKFSRLEGSHLIQLASPLPEFQNRVAILKEIQRNPLTSALVHVDLYEVDINKPIQVTVALHFVGKAEGVVAGGNLQPLMREITVECLPHEIPEFVEVDVSRLKVHDSIHVADITLPAGVKAVFDVNEAAVTISAQAAVAPTAEGATGAATSATQTTSEKK